MFRTLNAATVCVCACLCKVVVAIFAFWKVKLTSHTYLTQINKIMMSEQTRNVCLRANERVSMHVCVCVCVCLVVVISIRMCVCVQTTETEIERRMSLTHIYSIYIHLCIYIHTVCIWYTHWKKNYRRNFFDLRSEHATHFYSIVYFIYTIISKATHSIWMWKFAFYFYYWVCVLDWNFILVVNWMGLISKCILSSFSVKCVCLYCFIAKTDFFFKCGKREDMWAKSVWLQKLKENKIK